MSESLVGGSTLTTFLDGIRGFGLGTRIANPMRNRATLYGSPISGMRIEVKSDSSGDDSYYVHYEVNYPHLPSGSSQVKSKVVKAFPVFGRPKELVWRAPARKPPWVRRWLDDHPAGLDSILLRRDRRGDLTIKARPDLMAWDLSHGEGLSASSRDLWRAFESAAECLLSIPEPDRTPGSSSTDARPGPDDSWICANLAPVAERHFLSSMKDKSWLWWHFDEKRRQRAMQRARSLLSFVPSFVQQMTLEGLFDRYTVPTGLYLTGSYLWVDHPSDVDLIALVRGEHNQERFSPSDLRGRGYVEDSLIAPVSLVVAGAETVRRFKLGDNSDLQNRDAILWVVLKGAPLLAGAEGSDANVVTDYEKEALIGDLRRDIDRKNWPELGRDLRRIDDKVSWRETEILALRGKTRKRSFFFWKANSGW